jgi:hypothetical protein
MYTAKLNGQLNDDPVKFSQLISFLIEVFWVFL